MVNAPKPPARDSPITTLSVPLLRALASAFSRASGGGAVRGAGGAYTNTNTKTGLLEGDLCLADIDADDGAIADADADENSHFSLFDEGGLFAPGDPIPGPAGEFDDGDDSEDDQEEGMVEAEAEAEADKGAGRRVDGVNVTAVPPIHAAAVPSSAPPAAKRARHASGVARVAAEVVDFDSDSGDSVIEEDKGSWACLIA